MAQTQHIDAFRETNRTVILAARDASNKPQNLTGLTITWLAGFPPLSPGCAQAVITKAGTITNAAGGLYTISLIPSDTMFLDSGNYAHQAFTTDGSGNIAVVTAGQLRLRSIVEAA